MRRGDLVTIASPGDYAKPRPAIIIQSDHFDKVDSVVVVPLTSALFKAPLARMVLMPTPENGLRKPSEVMVDKITTLRRDRVGPVFGRVDDETLLVVAGMIAALIGFV